MAKEVSFHGSQPPVDNILRGYKERDLSQTHFFRVACRTFGPPKSRTRRIIAPPMETLQPGSASGKEEPPVASNTGIKCEPKRAAAVEETSATSQSVACWLLERKKFRTQLDNMGDLETWLRGKSDLTEVEIRVQDRMAERRRKVSQETVQDTVHKYKESITKQVQSRVLKPAIQQPNPEALALLQSYLNQHHLRLVDLYNQTDKSKKKKISSHDLKSVRKEANIPISDLQFDDLVISLSSKQPNHISYKDLSVGRYSWMKKTMEDRRNGVMVDTVRYVQPSSDHDTDCGDSQPAVTLSGSLDVLGTLKTGSSPLRSVQSGGSGYLQVPPVSLEERRPLSYEDMEDIGKNYRERKRRAKSNTRLLDWLEQCRLVRSGNATTDAHSLPSTLGRESAELVEQFRRDGLQQYYKILKLCQAHDVPLTEKLLEGALLYPGDKLITCGPGSQLPLRQPGTGTRWKDKAKRKFELQGPDLQETGEAPKQPTGTRTKSKDIPERKSGVSGSGLQATGEGPKQQSGTGTRTKHRSKRKSRASGHIEGSPESGDSPYPPESYVRWVRTKVRGKKKAVKETLRCWTTYEQFQEMIGNLKRQYPHHFFTSDDNAFWPGHLLEKLRIYLPKAADREMRRSPTGSCLGHRV